MEKITELKQTILEFLQEKLALDDFRRSHHLFYRNIPTGKQILHIAFIKRNYELEIKANADIRHNELERLYNVLLGESPDTPTATIGAEFGKLLGEESSMVWSVKDASDVPLVGNAILAIFRDVVLTFFEKYGSLEKIFEILDADDAPRQSFCPIPHVRAEKALLASYLLGQYDDYDDLVNTKLGYLTSINNPYVHDFLHFADRLREKVKTAREY